MRVLITGAGGFIGSRLAKDLADDGHAVTGTWHRDRSRLPSTHSDSLSFAQLDASDGPAVQRLFDAHGYDAVVHCAARLQRPADPGRFGALVADNVLAQANLLDAALATGCGRYVFCSTISVYGNRGAPVEGYHEADAAPNNAYGWSKLAGEEILDLATSGKVALRAVSLRLAGAHGIGRTSGALHAMTQAALAGETISVAEPESRFRWLFVDDLVGAVRAALGEALPAGHRVLNLASADIFSLGELAQRIKAVAISGSAIDLKPGTTPRNEVMNIEKAQVLLGYDPQPLDVFLRTYINSQLHPA